MNFKDIQFIKHLATHDYSKICDEYQYHEYWFRHSIGVRFPSDLRINPIAIKHMINTTSSRTCDWINLLYDYAKEINYMIMHNFNIDQIETVFDMPYQSRLVHVHNIENLTIDEAQKLIDDNISAFCKLTEYMSEKELIDQIEQL